jgi:hypothetical protein
MLKHLKLETLLNNTSEFSSHLIENVLRIHTKINELPITVQKNITYLFSESYDAINALCWQNVGFFDLKADGI